jgi:RHS repeat-associated protein
MPKEMYLNWLFRVQKDSTRKPYKFAPPQPFKKYNYNVQVMTAGNGENSEFFDQDTVIQVGTVQLNIITGKIVRFIEYQPEEMPDEIISRMYDPALGRFWQIDPLAEDFYPATPYNFALNNPVNFTDPDGRSAEPVIDEKNKTITVNVRIVFYGSGATQDNVDAAIATINGMWNANADDEGWSGAGDGWRIKVSATGQVTDEEGAQEIAEENEGNAYYSFVRVEEKNVAQGPTDPVTNVTDHKVSFLDGNSGFWITGQMKSTTPAHEMGHGFGLHPWHVNAEGINVAGTDNRKVTPGNLAEVRQNVLRNGQDKSSWWDKYVLGVKRVNYGSTNTQFFDQEGYEKSRKRN